MTQTSAGDEQVRGWFAGRIPDGWFTEAPEVTYDRDEILVVGTLAAPTVAEGASEEERHAAAAARIDGHREDTRRQRMAIADDAERAFGRKVSWGAVCGDTRRLFTVQAVPAMTRLRLGERRVLDTLVESGVARSRSHALAWCVRLVGEKQEEWLGDLREALKAVEQVRSEGPDEA
ncbi:MAG TPA: hypothetical protein VE032_01070 [Actinomycetota bacterium]|nr:hypothetical protein [Actinomycetota bacterium]